MTPTTPQPATARQRAAASHAQRPPGTPGPDGWAYSRSWAWKWTRGTAYRMVNLDWSPDTYAGVVDDFGNLNLVGWSA